MEGTIAELKEIINKLYAMIDLFGAYSPLSPEIQKACSGLTSALEEYEKMIKEEGK